MTTQTSPELLSSEISEMSDDKFINLYIYSDSLAFRRLEQPQDISFTYPFVLKGLIETRLGIRTNLLLRGGGGADIKCIKEILTKDSGYFGGDHKTLNIAILQVGIVDCAPQPITYLLAPTLRKIPIVGPKLLAKLAKHRRRLQALCSYTVTSRSRFQKEYTSIIRTCHDAKIRPIAVGLPLPLLAIEQRSPGFRRSASLYNQLIHDIIPESFCDIEQQINESLRESLLLNDGHHLTEDGHRFFAEKLFNQLQKNL